MTIIDFSQIEPANQIDAEKVVLGEELDIPYTVENMQTAFDNLLFNLKNKSKHSKLSKTFKDEESLEILPSHYYYRFLPKDSAEHNVLVNDTILQTTNVPLHFKIEQEGDYYQDPDLEGDGNNPTFSYLYAVVPYDHPLPENIQHEKLDNYYFAPELGKEEPEEGEIIVKQPINKTTKDILTVDENGEVFEYLELEALKLTNNLEEDELNALKFYLPNDSTATLYTYEAAHELGYEQKDLIIDLASIDNMLEQEEMAGRKKWQPSGKISVHEDAVSKTVGVSGAEVKVRKWGLVVIRRAYTNKNGEFKTQSTRTKRVKYSVYFQNSFHKFRIKAGNMLINAKHRGTRTYKRKSWNQHFSSGRSKFYALVHNAANDFYDRAVAKFGLHNPNKSWLRISAKYNQHAGDHLDLNPGGRYSLIPYAEIRVGRIKSGKPMASDQIYGLVTHEMTHASHYRMDPSFFINIRGVGCTLQTMAESWATGTETVLTNDRYLSLNPKYQATNRIGSTPPLNLYNSNKQARVIEHGSNYEYTPIVIDLVDNYNQRNELEENLLPLDRVKDYNLSQIQTSLKGSRGPHTWKERLKNQHYNQTEKYIDELFNVYMYDNCK
ncbi:MAG: hypothetical protein KDD31_08865 [Muricauda sp.]|nr:hypothetical protein [Allomuricauda sp.]